MMVMVMTTATETLATMTMTTATTKTFPMLAQLEHGLSARTAPDCGALANFFQA